MSDDIIVITSKKQPIGMVLQTMEKKFNIKIRIKYEHPELKSWYVFPQTTKGKKASNWLYNKCKESEVK